MMKSRKQTARARSEQLAQETVPTKGFGRPSHSRSQRRFDSLRACDERPGRQEGRSALNVTDGVAEAIACPTLVCDAEGDLFFKGQPQELYDHLTCPKTMIVFTSAWGAGAHCQVGASCLAFAPIYDWVDETLAG